MYEDKDYQHRREEAAEQWLNSGEEWPGRDLIHGLPSTGSHEESRREEEEDEEEEEEEEDEGNTSDEGYGTTTGTGNSPYSGTSLSDDKDLGKKTLEAEEGNNLMWLLDFKLDFFNEHEQSLPPLKDKPPESPRKEEGGSDPPIEDEDIPSPPVSSKDNDKIHRKPPYTYTELITQALKDKTALTVSGIYQWITDRYLFFKAEDDRWKNSVRHNLSMNPHFRKGTKSKHGAGHLWVLADYEEDCVPETDSVHNENEAAKAVKSILDSEEQKLAAAAQDSCINPSSFEESGKKGKRKRKLLSHEEEEDERRQRIEEPSIFVPDISTNLVDGQVFITETPGDKRIFLDLSHHLNADIQHHQQQPSHQTLLPPVLPSVASNVEISSTTQHVPFSPMEDMEELGVAGYCYEEDVASLENALGLDFHQRQLLAK